jgi:two-component system, OmpR family, phosphate regulon sensor histidine kinase PhoR
MKNRITSITIILAIVILLPAFFFSGYEITRQSANEKEIEKIYYKQLDAILSSIDYHSVDIISSWANKISSNEIKSNKSVCDVNKALFSDFQQIRLIIYFNYKTRKLITQCLNDTTTDSQKSLLLVTKLLADSSEKINRLAKYVRAAGYRKIEPLGKNAESKSFFMVFLSNRKDVKDSVQINVIELNEEKFIKDLLWQKIQMTAEDKFNIGVIDSKTSMLINPSGNTKYTGNFQIKKSFGLFPRYLMGIQLKGKTIELIAQERTRSNLLLIILADIVFILGAFFVFRNIRKEMKLTIIKSDFISNVSHEIRTPLALISMYIETLEMDRVKSEEKKKEYYRVIFNETHRLSGLVNKILNFSKIESGKRKYTFEIVDLNELVENILDSYKFHLKNKGFELETTLGKALGPINADKEAISESMVNLIDNAVKYSRDLKYIEINTGVSGGFVYFEIIDKGIGITRLDQKLIFDKFFRVSKGDNVHDVKGTGLGLTIVRNIVDAHNGRIEVESKPDEGSTFRILLPMKSNLKSHS